MINRDQILYEALVKNEQETEKWSNYTNDHNLAINNLDLFNKKLEIDIMVPIGKRALMAGKLCHTNEVFISHHGKMFSKCTTYQAKEICKHRINMAKTQLKNLQTERELFKNNLEVPQNIGMLPNYNEHEIIEEYDEEKETIWRENHRKNMKESKIREKQNKEKNITDEKSNENIMKMLNGLEEMEELEKELNDLGIQDDETLQKLITGEIKIEEKKRISHTNDRNSKVSNANNVEISEKKTLFSDEQFKDVCNKFDDEDENEESDVSSTSEIPKEIIEMEKQIEHESIEKQVEFYKKNIKITEKEIRSMKVTNPEELEIKMNKIEIRDYLLDLISILEDQLEFEGDNVEDNNKCNLEIKENNIDTKKNSINEEYKTKRRISFASEDQIKYINKSEKVTDMFKNTDSNLKRDVITLDPVFGLKNPIKVIHNINKIDKKKILIEKVEKSVEFVKEMQSHNDFDLVGKILDMENKNLKTLTIKFKQSNNLPDNKSNFVQNQSNENVIGSPADIYSLFSEHFPNNLDTKENLQNSNSENNEAYCDLRTEFSTQKTENITAKPTILRNKESVKNEVHLKEKTYMDIRKDSNQQNFHTPNTIVGEVIENHITEPDPLPEEKYIDVHTPKKRISRFKKLRTANPI